MALALGSPDRNDSSRLDSIRAQGANLRGELLASGIVRSPIPIPPEKFELICRESRDPDSAAWEAVKVGDSGDRHNLRVGRILIAKPGMSPTEVSRFASTVREILLAPPLQALYQGILDKPGPFFLRRGQFNVVPTGGDIGVHIDREADPDYLLVLIVHLDREYTGGEYVVIPCGTNEKRVLKPSPGEFLIGRVEEKHWVECVTSGERATLVMFLSDYNGPNRKPVD